VDDDDSSGEFLQLLNGNEQCDEFLSGEATVFSEIGCGRIPLNNVVQRFPQRMSAFDAIADDALETRVSVELTPGDCVRGRRTGRNARRCRRNAVGGSGATDVGACEHRDVCGFGRL
jgi:hypothetical protein